MKLKYVTLTGADDKTSASRMAALSAKYPYVEWAILFSQAKSGVPRYPSNDWIQKSLPILGGCNLSAHLCGKWVADVMDGRFTFMDEDDGLLSDNFRRFQLNLAGQKLKDVLLWKTKLWDCDLHSHTNQIILGGPYQKTGLALPVDSYFLYEVVPLFDSSGGRGIMTDTWPAVPVSEGTPLFCGYAGGLGPDNLEEQLKKIEDVVGDNTIWIDMESRIRNEQDEFDLALCEKVLEIAKAWV